MAHQAQINYCNEIMERFPEHMTGRTLDVGSLDINGSNKYMFSGEYIGLDLDQGDNVDVISLAHEYGAPDESFDCIISTECFEHDKHYEKSIKNIMRLLKPGGLFVFTCGTTGRQVHGTNTHHTWASPFTSKMWPDYYKNLTEEDFMAIDGFVWEKHEFKVVSDDLYFWGIK